MDMDWRDHAACRAADIDPEIFFPTGDAGVAVLQTAEAKAICATCPVITACARWAMDTDQTHGVWGGLSENERRRLKRAAARRRAAQAA